MNWFIAGWALVLQAVFWGYGLTLLVLPRRWRRFWPGFVAPVGLALQSAVVWAGTHTNLPGTDSYALAFLGLPLALALWVVWRQGGLAAWRTFAAARGWWVLLPVMALSLGLQITPFTKPPGLLTTQSLNSCDAADYAAGARVFKEFASRDRSGYLGQQAEVRLLDVDNFFDFWLRLNHFTPSALLALDSTLLRRQPYEITSLLGVVLSLLHLPTVFWLARSLFRFRPWAAGLVTAIYAFSPIVFYAVYQVALAQLLAAPTVALILWTCWQADRAVLRGRLARRTWAYAGLLLVFNSLLVGAYNFFLLFAYVPLVAYVGGRALLRWRRADAWRAVGRAAGFVAASLLACTVFFPARMISLGERFFLFNQAHFGWPIPTFRPDGWYGVFRDPLLHPAPLPSLLLGGLGLLAALAAAWNLMRRGRGHLAGLAAAGTLPILCGYAILSWEEAAHVTPNASYDAYKLFTVFYPILLPAFCLWLGAAWPRATLGRGLTLVFALALLGLNVLGSTRFNAVMRRREFAVERRLSELGTIENNPNVAEVNLCIGTMWDRLWANQFLLHRKQYFPAATYEGRNATPLDGRWDLHDRFLSVDLPPGQDALDDNPGFALLDRRSPLFLDLKLGKNWYPIERHGPDHWAWSNGSPATLTVTNPHPDPRAARLILCGESLHGRPVKLFLGNEVVWQGNAPAVQNVLVRNQLADVNLRLLPGENVLRIETPGGPDQVPGDRRTFGFVLRDLKIRPAVGASAAQP